MTPNEFYTSTLAECGTTLKRLGRRSLTVAMLRLAVFAATVAAIVMLWHSTAAVAACFVAGLIVFLYLAKFSNRLAAAKQIEEAKILWAQNHIDRLQLKLDKLPKGEQHADANHDYTFDIDVFGSKSLFSLLDSTATPYGSEQLAAWLKNPKETAADTVLRQEAVRELAAKNAFRLKMASAGTVATNEMAECKKVSDEVPDFSVNGIQKAAIAVIPYIYVILFTLMAFDIVPGLLIFNVFLLTLILGSLQAKRVGRLHEWITRKVVTVTCCADIFKTIEEEEFSSAVLQQLQRNMGSDRGNASELSRRLARYINNLDQRYNVFGYAIMNGFLLWDWRQLNNIDRWMKANGKHLDDWKNAIAEYDAFCALASFAFNNPGYTFPTLDTTGKVVMEAKQAGHPLIPSDRCVCNDIHCLSEGSFFVVTGANMAGKSTYLRTVAVNYLLALVGAPVFAAEMTFSPATLYTGLRTSDSLSDGASYFFAELSRLQKMVKRAEAGERMFVILDEILRGTNSVDKQKGSLGLVSKLVRLSVTGIIATHDLALGSLADSFPGKVSNYRFEAEIDGSRLTFSYRLLPGIAQNTNAYFLMQTMGII